MKTLNTIIVLVLIGVVFFLLQLKAFAEDYIYIKNTKPEIRARFINNENISPRQYESVSTEVSEDDELDNDLQARKGKGKKGKKGNKGSMLGTDSNSILGTDDFPKVAPCLQPVCEIVISVLPNEICQNECPQGSGFRCEGRHYTEPISLNKIIR